MMLLMPSLLERLNVLIHMLLMLTAYTRRFRLIAQKMLNLLNPDFGTNVDPLDEPGILDDNSYDPNDPLLDPDDNV